MKPLRSGGTSPTVMEGLTIAKGSLPSRSGNALARARAAKTPRSFYKIFRSRRAAWLKEILR